MLFDIATFLVTFMAGIGTGLLGIGGAIIIYPCFLFILPMFIEVGLTIGQISGIAAMQILTGSLSGFLSHRTSDKLLKKESLIKIAFVACTGTFSGGILSSIFSRDVMLGLYLFTVLLAIMSMLKKSDNSATSDSKTPLMYACILITGLFAGILGVGGAVLYIPILRYFKKLSTKEAIPTTVFIVFVGAIMTFIGKAFSGQILYSLLPLVFAGAFIGAKVGARYSKKASSKFLKTLLFCVLIITAIKVIFELTLK